MITSLTLMRIRYSFSSRHTRTIDNSNAHRQAFPKLVLDMIDRCEIILEIIDARFIDETRNPALEKLIKEKGKLLIYVLNKSDLVDIPQIKKKIQTLELSPYALMSVTERRGSSELRKRIKIEASKLASNFSKINVGVIGYPNTGKSSLINLLTGKNSARTAPEAGFTKGIQKIKLDSSTYLLDTPGIIPDSRYSMSDLGKMASQTKVSARNYDKIQEPDFVVHELIKQYPGILEKYYNIDAKGDSEYLLEELGKKKKFLLSKNRVDIDRTARLILKEWQEGKIKID